MFQVGLSGCGTSLAVFDGKVYAGLGNKGNALSFWKLIRQGTAPFVHALSSIGPPSIADGRLYVGMGNSDTVYSAEDLGGSGRGSFLHRSRHSESDSKYHITQTVLGTIAVMPDALLVPAMAICIRWTGPAILSSLECTSANHRLACRYRTACLFRDQRRHACVVGRHDLDPVWEFRVGTEDRFSVHR